MIQHRALIMDSAYQCPANGYERRWAFEFRYDGPRQRYLVRTLDPVSLYRIPGADRWTAYAGFAPIQDFVYDGSWNVVPTMDYIPGISEVDLTGGGGAGGGGGAPVAHYVHTDLLGSTWLRSDDPAGGNPAPVGRSVRTAFGELVGAHPAPFTRYGYAGAWGYQQHDVDTNGQGDGTADNTLNAPAAWGFPYLHVGARYYNPSTGRFLQRDPIGLSGGLNVYEYVWSNPLKNADPSGLWGLGYAGLPGSHLPSPPAEGKGSERSPGVPGVRGVLSGVREGSTVGDPRPAPRGSGSQWRHWRNGRFVTPRSLLRRTLRCVGRVGFLLDCLQLSGCTDQYRLPEPVEPYVFPSQ